MSLEPSGGAASRLHPRRRRLRGQGVSTAHSRLPPTHARYRYAAADELLDEQIEAQGPSFKKELADFRKLQAALTDLCAEHQAEPTCKWYRLTDFEIFHLVSKTGYTGAVPLM